MVSGRKQSVIPGVFALQWEWVRSFLTTAQTQSLAQAAERLHLTQPGVGKHIRKLEAGLGVKLFERSHQGMTLSPVGALAYKRLEVLWQQWLDFQLDIRAEDKNQPLLIGTLPTLAAYYLPPKLPVLREALEKEIKLNLRPTSREIFADLQAGEIDIAILDQHILPGDIRGVRLFEETFLVVLNSSHPLADRHTLTLRELEGDPWVTYPSSCEIRQAVEVCCVGLNIKLSVALELAHGESVIGQVIAGYGFAIVPETLVAHQGHKNLVSIPLTDIRPRSIVLVTRSAKLEEMTYPLLKGGLLAKIS